MGWSLDCLINVSFTKSSAYAFKFCRVAISCVHAIHYVFYYDYMTSTQRLIFYSFLNLFFYTS